MSPAWFVFITNDDPGASKEGRDARNRWYHRDYFLFTLSSIPSFLARLHKFVKSAADPVRSIDEAINSVAYFVKGVCDIFCFYFYFLRYECAKYLILYYIILYYIILLNQQTMRLPITSLQY
jgi:hypothetical protein